MTTPSKNVNIYIPAPFQAWQYNNTADGWKWVRTINREENYRRFADSRPASVSSKKDASGWRSPTSWWHEIAEVICPPNGAKQIAQLGPNSTYGFKSVGPQMGLGVDLNLPSVPSWLTDTALTKAYSKLKNAGGGLGENLGQRKQAEKEFIRSAETIARQVRRFRYLNARKWARVVSRSWREIPSQWLALQYGWKPMMQDVQGACEVASNSQSIPPRKRVTGEAQDKGTRGLNYYLDSVDWSRKTRWRCQVRVILYFELDNPYIIPYAQLGLTNPADIVWELVPYSFVVDWFYPIGPWIETWDATLGWKFRGGTRTVWREVHTELNGNINPGVFTRYPDSFFYSEPLKALRRRMDRSVYNSAPRVGSPHFKNPLSPQHVANAMSLLVSAFR